MSDLTSLQVDKVLRETACLFALLLPGRTAIVMLPAAGARTFERLDQRQLMDAGLDHLRSRQLYYVQALVEPEAEEQRELLATSGFAHLTQLIYLRRGAARLRSDRAPERQAN